MRIAVCHATMRHHTATGAAQQARPDLICLSHLRWNFVFQRPQHLMTRFARRQRVYFVEEPLFEDIDDVQVSVEHSGDVLVIVPRMPRSYRPDQVELAQRSVLDQLIRAQQISRYVLWYYTPAALRFSAHLTPDAIVYDCMDELSAFKNASSELPALERALMKRADVVFTGGQSLYEAKFALHSNIHAVPSSVDVAHFATARTETPDPADQRAIGRPRIGFFGVLDERLDIPLLAAAAAMRPSWQFVMIGPVVKIDRSELPDRPNIHYLGAKTYGELPRYLAGWDVAMLPFARNEATRFISPTKTPEYLAAGKPVVSTSIRDVVSPYGERGLVLIADRAEDFVAACQRLMTEPPEPRRVRADLFLRSMSWDRTWMKTASLVDAVLRAPAPAAARAQSAGPQPPAS
jgi:glycosyltransferase involved in cell wall biosynthesis